MVVNMQKFSSQQIGKVKTETFVSDDGATLHFFVNGVKKGERELDKPWSFGNIEQSVKNNKIIFKMNGEVIVEADFSGF